MSDSALIAFGTLTKLGDAAGTAWTTIPECKGAPIPGSEHARIDVSTHDNSAFAKEYVAGMSDIPTAQLEANWLPANAVHMALQALNANGNIRIFKTYLNAAAGGGVITFPAYVANWNPAAPVDNVYTVNMTLQPTAAATYGSS